MTHQNFHLLHHVQKSSNKLKFIMNKLLRDFQKILIFAQIYNYYETNTR